MAVKFLMFMGRKFLIVIPIIADGACLFRAFSHVIYGSEIRAREVRAQIIDHVVVHWDEFSIISHRSYGNNYLSADEYFADMSKLYRYGSLCELIAASQIFYYVFEVYYNQNRYEKFGVDGNPIIRLHFTGNLFSCHFDVYVLHSKEAKTIASLNKSDSSFETSPLFGS